MRDAGDGMAKGVLIVRGGSLGRNSGLGSAHHNLVDLLSGGAIHGWKVAEVCEYPLEVAKNPFSRLWRRWFKHPKTIRNRANELSQQGDAQIIHITDQEQAHLVPKNSKVPVCVTVHDLFHLFPSTVSLDGEIITVGEQNPGFIRRKDLKRIKNGLSRADFLLCDSKFTKSVCEEHFPNVKSLYLPLGIECSEYYPTEQSTIDLPNACNLLIVGSNDPRKRMKFIFELLEKLDEEIFDEIHIHYVGDGKSTENQPSVDELIVKFRINNWTSYGSKTSAEDLMSLRHNCEALLFPSASEGFGYPPLESMAAGMEVLCSDLPSHNELMPENYCLPAENQQIWLDKIVEIHSLWKARNGEKKTPNEELISHAKNFDNKKFCERIAEFYDDSVE